MNAQADALRERAVLRAVSRYWTARHAGDQYRTPTRLTGVTSLNTHGDKISARMAFRDTYTRITTHNKTAGIAPVWQPSLGCDVEGRTLALEEAERLGRLSHEQVIGLLPHREEPSNLIANVLALPSAMPLSEEDRHVARQHLGSLRLALKGVAK